MLFGLRKSSETVNGLKPFWVVCVTHMFVEVYYLTQVALIPVFISEFNLSLLEASLVATVPGIVQLLANLPSGLITGRFTTKQLLFTSMVTEGLAALLVSKAMNFWILLLGISAMRLCSPIYHISGLSYISQIIEREKMNRSMGFHNALGSFGSAIGLIILSIFLSTEGWRWSYVFWALPMLIWGFVILRSGELEIRSSDGDEFGKIPRYSRLPSSAFLIFLVATGLRAVGYSGAQTYMAVYLVGTRGFSESAASLIFGFGTFAGIIGSLNGGYLGEKVGAKKALSLAIICSAISLFVLGLLSQRHLLVVAYLAYAFFSSSIWSPMNSLVADITPKEGRGMSYSVYFFTEGLVVSVTPTIAATLIGLSEIWFVFPFSVAFFTSSLIVLQFLSCSTKTSTIEEV